MAPDSKNKCVISTVDTLFALNIPTNWLGRQVLEFICNKLSIYETLWFGLLFQDTKGNEQWVDLKRKVNMKDVKPFAGTNAHFQFTIKFLPECMKVEIIQDTTKEVLFFNLFHKIIFEKDSECLVENLIQHCATYVILLKRNSPNKTNAEIVASLIKKVLTESITNHYNLSTDAWAQLILSVVEKYDTQHPIECIEDSLATMEACPTHGVKYFKITNKRKTELFIGVDCYGICVYKKNDKVNPCIAFQWTEIHNVSYAGKTFTIRPVNKSDPDLVFYSLSVTQNDVLLELIAGNHINYKNRRTPDSEDQKDSLKKAKEAHEKELAARKEFEQQQEVKLRYLNKANQLIKDGGSESKKQIEDEFQKTKDEMAKQIEEAKNLAMIEREKSADAQKEAEELRKQALELESKLVSDAQAKERMTAIHNTQMTELEKKNQEVERLAQELEALKLQHKKDLESLASVGGTESAKKSEPVAKNYQEARKQKAISVKNKMEEMGDILKKGEIKEDCVRAQIREKALDGKDRFQTLKAFVSKGNTKARVDEFESF